MMTPSQEAVLYFVDLVVTICYPRAIVYLVGIFFPRFYDDHCFQEISSYDVSADLATT